MNREIKFRVWCNTTKHFTDIPFYSCSGGQLLWHHTGNQITISNIDDGDYVIQQYTGLKDKNGKEIYEGDIVNFTKRGMSHGPEAENVKNAEVWYSSEDCAFVFGKYKSVDYTWWYSMVDVLYDFEVVGNIFENKELLGQ
jgi:uncharacterized phage protein (TIGR01671 family)